ncbi:MAG TPA: protein-disulfide reductase DsbD domain-containing protein, partial [Myxococcota bacterium]|nr:protein-disulfide reductase DsbD domain-containing protein [Myxococcota bacterium]
MTAPDAALDPLAPGRAPSGWRAPLALVAALASLAAHPRPQEVPPEALGQSPVTEGHARIAARLVTDAAAITPGESFRIGVWFEMDPGWHLYWRNPGGAGFPTELDWQVGDATVGPIQWPAPQVFREADGTTTYGYAGETLLFASATASDSVGASLSLVVTVRYLACNIICSPGEVTLRRALPVGHVATAADEGTLGLFARHVRQVPGPATAAGILVESRLSQSAVRAGDDFKVAVTVACAKEGPCDLVLPGDPFVPDAEPGLSLRLGSRSAHAATPGQQLLILEGHAAPTESGPHHAPELLRGVLLVQRGKAGVVPVAWELPLPRADAEALVQRDDDPVFSATPALTAAPATPVRGLVPESEHVSAWRALGLALLGGLLLNLMPCVLPV